MKLLELNIGDNNINNKNINSNSKKVNKFIKL